MDRPKPSFSVRICVQEDALGFAYRRPRHAAGKLHIGGDDDLPRLPAPPYDDVLIAQAVQTATGRREYKERTRRAAERRMATA